MSEGRQQVDRIEDRHGGKVTIAVNGSVVELQTTGGVYVELNAEARNLFARAWNEAERQAEAHQQAARDE